MEELSLKAACVILIDILIFRFRRWRRIGGEELGSRMMSGREFILNQILVLRDASHQTSVMTGRARITGTHGLLSSISLTSFALILTCKISV